MGPPAVEDASGRGAGAVPLGTRDFVPDLGIRNRRSRTIKIAGRSYSPRPAAESPRPRRGSRSQGTMTTSELARLLGGPLVGDESLPLRGVAGLENAGPNDLSFAENEKALALAGSSNAGCILIPETITLRGHTTITVAHPKFAFVQAAEAILPVIPAAPRIHPTAVVSAEATSPKMLPSARTLSSRAV